MDPEKHPSISESFELLSSNRRRLVFQYLKQHPNPIALDALAARVARWEQAPAVEPQRPRSSPCASRSGPPTYGSCRDGTHQLRRRPRGDHKPHCDDRGLAGERAERDGVLVAGGAGRGVSRLSTGPSPDTVRAHHPLGTGYVRYDDGLSVVDDRVRDAARDLAAASAGVSPPSIEEAYVLPQFSQRW